MNTTKCTVFCIMIAGLSTTSASENAQFEHTKKEFERSLRRKTSEIVEIICKENGASYQLPKTFVKYYSNNVFVGDPTERLQVQTMQEFQELKKIIQAKMPQQ